MVLVLASACFALGLIICDFVVCWVGDLRWFYRFESGAVFGLV